MAMWKREVRDNVVLVRIELNIECVAQFPWPSYQRKREEAGRTESHNALSIHTEKGRAAIVDASQRS